MENGIQNVAAAYGYVYKALNKTATYDKMQ